MRHRLLVSSLLLVASSVLLGATLPRLETAPFDHTKDITLPPGFVIEKIAGPPLVKHPLHISLDDKGRAYVTEMAGINRNGKQLEKELPNGIKRLIEKDGDGIFDEATQFADKMTFPGGVQWHQGAVYATSFPSLWKFIDKNDDGIADERIPLLSSFGSIGNGADLHGPQLGPDGWLYFCDGRNGHDLTMGDGTKIKGHASGLYRCKPDGTMFERLFAGGMDNPVEVAFSAAGEPFVITNLIMSNPRHDGVLLGIDGAVYPYDLKAVKQLPWTGQYLPIMGDMGWVAVASIVQQTSNAWSEAYRGKYLVAEFNTHGITSTSFARQGASFAMKSEPFLKCKHPDFHPTQLVLAPDGSIILVDTGGWFRNGCPTSGIEKPTIQGGIYRIRQTNQPRSSYVAKPTKTPSYEELKAQLGSEKPAERLSALWGLGHSLCTKVDPTVQEAIRFGLSDTDVDCKITALRFVGQYRDEAAYEAVLALLDDAQPAVRREAAATLARLQNVEAVPHLVQGLSQAEDPFLEHALIHALIKLKHAPTTLTGLQSPSPRVQRGALIALDQMPGDALQWDHVAQLLQSSDPRLQQATTEVMARHPLWVNDLADYVDRELSHKQLESNRLEGLKNLLTSLAAQPRMQQLIADRLACPEERGTIRYLILEVMNSADLKQWPALWTGPLQQFLSMPGLDNELLLQGILVAGTSQQRAYDSQLRTVAESADRSLPVRLAAASVALADGKPVSDALFTNLRTPLRSQTEPTQRLSAVRALSVASLNPSQLQQLQDDLRQSGPLELPLLLSAWERNTEVDRLALIPVLMKAPGLPALPLDRLKKLFEKCSHSSELEQLYHHGRPDLAAQKARLDQLKPILTGGDPKKGRELFFSTKAVCSTCHRVGNDGGLIGPNLTTIGKIRTRADLLESILYPNASLARGYETLVVVNKSGATLTGVLTRESADALVLTNSQRQEQKVLRTEIEQMAASTVSTMPAGLDQTLTSEDLQHLLAYLETLKK